MGNALCKSFFASTLLLFSPICAQESSSLFHDFELLSDLNRKINDQLPLAYNYSFVGGYFTMPSARMAKCGTIAIGAAWTPPYVNYGVNFQPFDHLELVGNYKIFRGILEKNFGHKGFGDDAERIGNFKVALLLPEDGFSLLPTISVGAEDFVGTKRFKSKYVVVTKSWLDANLEITLGWGKGRIRGPFGGFAWSPFRKSSIAIIKNISFIAEYDATNYKKHIHEHPKGRKVASRVNGGISYLLADTLQLSVSSLRGREVAGSVSLRYPLGTSTGLLPKVQDAITYCSPVDTEPLGALRDEKELTYELAYAFADQGLDLFTARLLYTPERKKLLWLKIVNNRYREENVVRDRVQHLLAALTPADIEQVMVLVESDGVISHAYSFRREDLVRFHTGLVGGFELETLSPMIEAPPIPSDYDSTLLYHRNKRIWTFTIHPRLVSFFGSARGKFKYSLGAMVSPEGYLFDRVYYRMLFSYTFLSSTTNLNHQDLLNPSYLINVRTDSIRYYQSNTVSMDEAFAQKSWNLGRGWFYRFGLGYFEPAYGGAATELLYFPVKSRFAVGLEAATVFKRHYRGVGFTNKIRKLKKNGEVTHVPFVGLQYFLDLYYDFRPLKLEFKVTAGQFLAKDLGIRTEVTRYFQSGLRFSVWFTYTNAHDIVNGKTYYDKGFAFTIPFDMFLKQSSRNYLGYAMSVWLRDQGAQAETGKKLYWTLREERRNYDER